MGYFSTVWRDARKPMGQHSRPLAQHKKPESLHLHTGEADHTVTNNPHAHFPDPIQKAMPTRAESELTHVLADVSASFKGANSSVQPIEMTSQVPQPQDFEVKTEKYREVDPPAADPLGRGDAGFNKETLSVNSVLQGEDNLATEVQIEQSTFDDPHNVEEQSRLVRAASNLIDENVGAKGGGNGRHTRPKTFDTSRDSGLGTPSEFSTQVAEKTKTQTPQFDNAHPASPQGGVLLSEHQRYLQMQHKFNQARVMAKKVDDAIDLVPSQKTVPPQKPVSPQTAAEPAQIKPQQTATTEPKQTAITEPKQTLTNQSQPIEAKPIAKPSGEDSVQGSDAFDALIAKAKQRQKPEQSPAVKAGLHIGRIDVVVTAEPQAKPTESPQSNVMDGNWDSQYYLRSV